MPINKAYPLEKLIEAIIQYGKDTNNKNYLLIYIIGWNQ